MTTGKSHDTHAYIPQKPSINLESQLYYLKLFPVSGLGDYNITAQLSVSPEEKDGKREGSLTIHYKHANSSQLDPECIKNGAIGAKLMGEVETEIALPLLNSIGKSLGQHTTLTSTETEPGRLLADASALRHTLQIEGPMSASQIIDAVNALFKPDVQRGRSFTSPINRQNYEITVKAEPKTVEGKLHLSLTVGYAHTDPAQLPSPPNAAQLGNKLGATIDRKVRTRILSGINGALEMEQAQLTAMPQMETPTMGLAAGKITRMYGINSSQTHPLSEQHLIDIANKAFDNLSRQTGPSQEIARG